jgi:hypothetical protein
MLSKSFLKTICLLAISWPYTHLQAQTSAGYDIKVTFKPYSRGYVYLAHYFGKSIYVKDSVPLDANGQAEFKGTDPLQGGVYMLVNPGKSQLVEMLVDNKDQHFSIYADSTDLVRKTKFTGSQENTLFTQYQIYAADQFAKVKPLQAQLASATVHTHADTLKVGDQIQALNKETIKYHPHLTQR